MTLRAASIAAAWALSTLGVAPATGLGQGPPAATAAMPAADPKSEPYVKAGVPDPGRPWPAKDYQLAVAALRKIRRERMLPLPRLRDDPSGAVFARIVDRANLLPLADRTTPIALRYSDLLGDLSASTALLALYRDPTVRRQPYGPELLALNGLTLRLTRLRFETFQELTASLPESRRHDPSRQSAFKQMSDGLTQQVQGVLALFGETSIYDLADLREFASQLPELLPALWDRLDPAPRAEVFSRIDALAKSHSDPGTRAALQAVLAAIAPMKAAREKSAKG